MTWTPTTAVHLERQLRAALEALQAAGTLEEREAQVRHLRALASPTNLAALVRLLDDARAQPRAEEHTLPVPGPRAPLSSFRPALAEARERYERLAGKVSDATFNFAFESGWNAAYGA